jgi:TolB protein
MTFVRPLGRVLAVLVLAGCGSRPSVTAPTPGALPASDSAPSWSPDGTRIAYSHFPGTAESAERAGIYVVDANGGAPTQVLVGTYSYPDWSPDGRFLAVTRRRESQYAGIYTVRANGESLKVLSWTKGYAVRWSRDGSMLAFETYDTNQVYRLWVMGSDGWNARCLNPTGSEGWLEPDWSPDGSRLVHARLRAGTAEAQLFVMDTNGGAEQRLTDDGFEARYPAWSPDGQWIAWGSWHGKSPELWVMKADGTEPRKVAKGYWPEWAPDSRRIVYTVPDPGSGGYHVFTVDRQTGETRQITF